MQTITVESLARYWSQQEVAVNLIVFANLVGALLLGLFVGYERTYHGRAAGMRTYGLVCMASCAITVVCGFPAYFYGGIEPMAGQLAFDPTRVIQGIVTGVGFLGAGVIMKEGLNISGLTTAASIWCSSAIGILVGLGFYFSAILLSALSAALMMWASKIEQWLPSRPAIAITIRFRAAFTPQLSELQQFLLARGYTLAMGSFQVHQANGRHVWRCVAIAQDKIKAASVPSLGAALDSLDGAEEFDVLNARN